MKRLFIVSRCYSMCVGTLDGRRVERPTKGVYITQGKKIVIQ
jgi:hypothetical protein